MIFLQSIINGLLVGGVYASVALGFSIVWGVMGVINLAHGSLIIIGAYVTFWTCYLFRLDPFATIPFAMAFNYLLGYLIQKYLLNLLIRTHIFMVFILTFGIDILLSNVSNLLFSGDYRSVTPSIGGGSIGIGDLLIPNTRLLICLSALALTFLMNLYITRTKMGNAIRATSLNKEAAQLMGIRIGKIYAATFALSSAFAGAAGSLLVMIGSISPFIGSSFTFKAALITCLGGIGSMLGVIAGGFVVGMAETMGSYMIGPGYKGFIGFLILVLILVLKPEGIMGKKFFTGFRN